MRKYLKLAFFGVLAWLIPFVSSFLFFSKEGTLLIDRSLFKSIMVVEGVLVGAWLFVIYFKKVQGKYFYRGLEAGLVWLIVNWALDYFFLLPMAKTTFAAYFMDIGLRYLAMPIMGGMIGLALRNKKP